METKAPMGFMQDVVSSIKMESGLELEESQLSMYPKRISLRVLPLKIVIRMSIGFGMTVVRICLFYYGRQMIKAVHQVKVHGLHSVIVLGCLPKKLLPC